MSVIDLLSQLRCCFCLWLLLTPTAKNRFHCRQRPRQVFHCLNFIQYYNNSSKNVLHILVNPENVKSPVTSLNKTASSKHLMIYPYKSFPRSFICSFSSSLLTNTNSEHHQCIFANKSHCIPLYIKNRIMSSTYTIQSLVYCSQSHFGSFLLIFVINLAQKAECLFHDLHNLRRWFVLWAKERHSVLRRILVLKAESKFK